MKISFRTSALLGVLFLGIASASAVWLFLVPRDRGVTNAYARRVGYANAEQRTQVHALADRIRKNKRMSDNDVVELKRLLQSSNPGARGLALVACCSIPKFTHDKEQNSKALDLVISVANHPNVDMRRSVAQLIIYFHDIRAYTTLETLTHDQNAEVRQDAQASLEMIAKSYNTQLPSWNQ